MFVSLVGAASFLAGAIAAVSVPHLAATLLRFLRMREHLDRRVVSLLILALGAYMLTRA